MNFVVENLECKIILEFMNNIFKIVLVSGINVVKLVSIVENVISINVRTVFLLVVYFKSMKNVLISSKYGFFFFIKFIL